MVISRRRRPAEPLSRERVLGAAIRLADQVGLDALTMRRLGDALGVEAMSLYHHVASKDELLEGMFDVVIGEIDLPVPGEPWQEGMRRRAYSARDVFARHPWAIGRWESSRRPSEPRYRYANAVLGCLREAGFGTALAFHAFITLDSFIYGYVLQARAMPFDDPAEANAATREVLPQLSAVDVPYLFELASERAGTPDFDYSAEFDFGLELILGALDRELRGR